MPSNIRRRNESICLRVIAAQLISIENGSHRCGSAVYAAWVVFAVGVGGGLWGMMNLDRDRRRRRYFSAYSVDSTAPL